MRISDWSSDVCSSDLSCSGSEVLPRTPARRTEGLASIAGQEGCHGRRTRHPRIRRYRRKASCTIDAPHRGMKGKMIKAILAKKFDQFTARLDDPAVRSLAIGKE